MAPVFSQFQPDGERYRSLNLYLKKLFGEKVYKVTLNGGMTCPNRDGHIGTGGCIFCSAMGSGDFAKTQSEKSAPYANLSLIFKRLQTLTLL